MTLLDQRAETGFNLDAGRRNEQTNGVNGHSITADNLKGNQRLGIPFVKVTTWQEYVSANMTGANYHLESNPNWTALKKIR